MVYPWAHTSSTCLYHLTATVVLIYQQAVAAFSSVITAIILRPIGIPLMISQFLAAILIGPSFLGHITGYQKYVFPPISIPMLTFYCNFSMVLQLFLIGIQVDPRILMNLERKVIVISLTIIILPLALSLTSARLISVALDLDDIASLSLYFTGAAQSLNSFPVVAHYLHELKIVNTELSRVAFSCAMISGFLCYYLQTIFGYVAHVEIPAKERGLLLLHNFLFHIILLAVSVYLLRPLMMRIIEEIEQRQEINKGQISSVIITALVVYWVSDKGGIQPYFAVFLFGAIIPAEPPLGSALVERLHFFTSWMVMPMFYTWHGIRINVFAIELKTAMYVGTVLIISWTGKFLGAFLPALYFDMTLKEATLLGIAMNAKGFLEIGFFRILEEGKLIDFDTYNISCIAVLIMTGSLVPIVRYLYSSSMKWKLGYVRSIQQTDRNNELRVLACLFHEENLPPMMHLLKAMSLPKDVSVIASVIHFIELVGRSAPVIISHRLEKKITESNPASQRILNVFKWFADKEKREIAFRPYTVISPYTFMHNDVCIISINERNSLIILPFHEQSSTGANLHVRTVNLNVLDKAPCSVGIIIDRGHLGGLKYVFEDWTTYRIVVFFFSGADDREAISLGERMLGNPTVELTVIRFCKVGEKLKSIVDHDMVNRFALRTADHDRMKYIEEEVNNGLEVIRWIETSSARYDLIMLGRRHDEDDALLDEFAFWNTYPELGNIGDMFRTSGYGGDATILVLQQQLVR